MRVEQAIRWISLFNKKIQDNKEYLSELDTPIGDGDHGSNMARGMTSVMESIDHKNFETSSEVFKIVAMELLSKVGGASGPLYGSAFMGLSKAASNSSLSELLQNGLDMIKKRGKAELGEKTMVDVWIPVIESLNTQQLTQSVIEDSVNRTKNIIATKGRASYVGERSKGHIDPGAYSSGLLFAALLETEVSQ